MAELFDQFYAVGQQVDRGAPLPAQLDRVLDTMGLQDERGRAARVAPQFVRLFDEVAMRLMARPERSQAGKSARVQLDTQRRERSEAMGQIPMDLDLHGSTVARLKDHLSFTFWLIDGAEVPVDTLLQDGLLRAQVLAELAEEHAQARRIHDMARRDVMVWAELKDRADAHEASAAA